VTHSGYSELYRLCTGDRKFHLLNSVGLKNIECVLEGIQLIFYQFIIDHIVAEPNTYADYCI
jgi:hypothetical protein